MKANGHLPKVKVLNRTEGRRLFRRQVRRSLNMSPEEFIRKWKAREFDDPENPEIMRLAFLMPFGG
jgi:hypothetical protein